MSRQQGNRTHNRTYKAATSLWKTCAVASLAIAILATGSVGVAGQRTATADTSAGSDTATLRLYTDGAWSGPVVIREGAAGPVRYAAEVLTEHLTRITGTAPDTVILSKDDTLPAACFVVGEKEMAAKAGVSLPDDITDDGFIVRVAGTRLVLAGSPPRGALYAVADFLERELGCRWFSENRIVIPERSSITATIYNRHENPVFRHRMPWDTTIPEYAGRQTTTRQMWRDWRDGKDTWGRISQNRGGSVHGFHSLLVPVKEYFEEHPEYYSHHFGQKTGGIWFHEYGQLNYHNKDVVRIATENTIKALEKNSRIEGYIVSQNDWLGWNEDDVTNDFDAVEGSVAASHVNFVNQVAAAAAKAFPDRYIVTLAYLYSYIPPKTLSFQPNVRVYVCIPDGMWGHALAYCGRFGKSYLDYLKTWADKSSETLTWYYHHFTVPTMYLSPDIGGFQADFQGFRDAGIEGVFGEVHSAPREKKGKKRGGLTFYFDDLRPYVLARLSWNPDMDMDAFIKDFHIKYFGPKSGPKMLEFYYGVMNSGTNTFVPTAWNTQQLDKLEEIAAAALPLADDAFARVRILEARRSVELMRMMKTVCQWRLEDGRWKNGYDDPKVPDSLKTINELTTTIGDEPIPADNVQYDAPAHVLKNDGLQLTIVPRGGGAITQIIDRTSGHNYAASNPYEIRSPGTYVGGYQEIAGFQFSAPGIKSHFELVKADDTSVTVGFDDPKTKLRIERTVTILDDGASFRIDSRMINNSDKELKRGYRLHPMLHIGDPEDVYFGYRTDRHTMVAYPVPVQECLSAGWGPMGMWAMINPDQNRGIVWRSPAVHNGHYVWAMPIKGVVSCETVSEHGQLKPGETLEVTQTYTILRDAASWARSHNMPIPFGDEHDATLPAPDEQGKRTALRPLSKAEKWHRENGLFFSGWYNLAFDDPELFDPYQELYPQAFAVGKDNVKNVRLLEQARMPWMLRAEVGPCMTKENWKAQTLPDDVTFDYEVGYVVDEDVKWQRDSKTSRMRSNVMRVERANKMRPDALTCIGLHAHSRQYGCIRIAEMSRPDVVAGEVYPFLHSWDHAGTLFWQHTWAREAGRRTGRPWWNFTQTFGRLEPNESGKGVRLPSESEQRLQIFAALAWGYTGFLDYVYNLPEMYRERGTTPLLVEPDGSPTRAYLEQKRIIEETMNLGKGLSQLRHLRAGRYEDAGRVFQGLGVRFPERCPVAIGRFMDDTGDDSYFMITNSTSHAKKTPAQTVAKITLLVEPARDILELNRRTGKVDRHTLKAAADGQPAKLTLTLPGGTGTLLKVDNGRPFVLLENSRTK